jgi:hypothetical protein
VARTASPDAGAALLTLPPAGPLSRPHVALRALLAPALALLGCLAPWIHLMAHVAVPAVASLHLAQMGRERFLREEAPRIGDGLAWLLALHAYACLLTDRLPLWGAGAVRLDVHAGGRPSPLPAAARVVTGLPAALALMPLALASALACPLGWGCVLARGRAPAALRRLQEAALRALAGHLLRHASLVGPGARVATFLSPVT